MATFDTVLKAPSNGLANLGISEETDFNSYGLAFQGLVPSMFLMTGSGPSGVFDGKNPFGQPSKLTTIGSGSSLGHGFGLGSGTGLGHGFGLGSGTGLGSGSQDNG